MEQNNTMENAVQPLPERSHTPLIIIISVIVVISAIVGGWFWKQKVVAPSSVKVVAPLPENTTAGLGTQISESVENPTAGKVPETNPFNVETNPLKGTYQNPFQ
ncbi:MAG: hypothetical protein AAB552_01960 [Patescibacteria group bacterium]